MLAASKPTDWRAVDARHTLYLQLSAGRVVIELAPGFAPRHVANIEALVRAKYFDGLRIERVQDDYVVQWGDPDGRRPVPPAMAHTPPEFESRVSPATVFEELPDGDVYASSVGFVGGLPTARSADHRLQWLVHCYGMVGVGRDLAVDSGSGAELYAVIGHAPRHLDRNVALVGRVLRGIELLSAQPRGSGAMGFYAPGQEAAAITSIRIAADLPDAEQVHLEVLRTDTPTFAALVESRRNRPEDFFELRAGRIDLCNVPLPVRERP